MEVDDEGASAVRQLAARIRKKKGVVKATAWTKRANNHSRMKGSVDAKKRSVGQFVKHLSGMGIKADASAMPNLKTRTLPGAPGPRIIVRGRGDDERGARAAGSGRAARSSSADAHMEGGEGAEEGGVRVRSSSVPRDRHISPPYPLYLPCISPYPLYLRYISLQVPRDRSMTRRDSASIARSQSPARVGLRDGTMIKKAEKMAKRSTFRGISKQASPAPCRTTLTRALTDPDPDPDPETDPDPQPQPQPQPQPPAPAPAPASASAPASPYPGSGERERQADPQPEAQAPLLRQARHGQDRPPVERGREMYREPHPATGDVRVINPRGGGRSRMRSRGTAAQALPHHRGALHWTRCACLQPALPLCFSSFLSTFMLCPEMRDARFFYGDGIRVHRARAPRLLPRATTRSGCAPIPRPGVVGAPRQAAGVPHPRIAQLEVVEHPHGHLGARFPAALGHELLPRHVEPQPARAAQLLAHLVRVRGWVWLGLGLGLGLG